MKVTSTTFPHCETFKRQPKALHRQRQFRRRLERKQVQECVISSSSGCTRNMPSPPSSPPRIPQILAMVAPRVRPRSPVPPYQEVITIEDSDSEDEAAQPTQPPPAQRAIPRPIERRVLPSLPSYEQVFGPGSENYVFRRLDAESDTSDDELPDLDISNGYL